MRGREKFQKIKPIIDFLVKIIIIMPFKMRIKRFYRLRRVRGSYGLFIRYIYLKSISPKCGDNVSVHEDVYLLGIEDFVCGNNVSIHPMCYLDATGGIEVGNDVSIAHGATVMSSEHNFGDLQTNIKDQGIILKKTTIGSNVWIGAKATVLAGKSIGCGCVVGANSVVTRELEENSVAVGAPARIIKHRS